MTQNILMGRGRRWLAIAMLTTFGAALGGCSSGLSGFDPSDMLDFLDTKKKLPGERKLVFPEGVPGLQPGVPKDLYKGAQAEPEPVSASPVVAEPKGRKETKSRTANRGPASPPRASAPVEAEPEAAAEAKPRVIRRRTTAPPPDEAPPQAAKPAPAPAQAARPAPAAPTQSASSPFPAPLPSGSFTR